MTINDVVITKDGVVKLNGEVVPNVKAYRITEDCRRKPYTLGSCIVELTIDFCHIELERIPKVVDSERDPNQLVIEGVF